MTREPRQSIAGGVVRVAAANLSTAAAAAVVTPLITHSIGVTGQGIATGATAPLLLVSSAATLGVPSAVIYAGAQMPAIARWLVVRASAITVLAGLCFTGAIVALSHALAAADSRTAHLMALVSLFIVPSLLVGVLRGAAMGLQRWQAVAMEQAVSALVTVVGVLILLAASALTIRSATILISGAPVSGAIAYSPLARLPRRLPTEAERLRLRAMKLQSYAARVWAGSLTGIVLARLDQSLMVPLSGPRQLGLYSIAVNLSEVTLLINQAVANIMFSVESASQDAERLTRAGRISTILIVAGSVCMAGGSYLLIGPLFGSGFRSALPCLLVLLAAVSLGNPGSVAGAGLQARGHPGLRSLALTIACGVNAVAVVLLVPPMGATGAALATVLGNLVSSNACLLFLRRHSGISPLDFYVLRRADLEFLTTRLVSMTRQMTRVSRDKIAKQS